MTGLRESLKKNFFAIRKIPFKYIKIYKKYIILYELLYTLKFVRFSNDFDTLKN